MAYNMSNGATANETMKSDMLDDLMFGSGEHVAQVASESTGASRLQMVPTGFTPRKQLSAPDYEARVRKDLEGARAKVLGGLTWGDIGATLKPPKAKQERVKVNSNTFEARFFRQGFTHLLDYYKRMCVANSTATGEEKAQLVRVLQALHDTVVCNGDWLTIHTRWVKGQHVVGFSALRGYGASKAFFQAVCEALPMNTELAEPNLAAFRSGDFRAILRTVEMNKTASLGLPVMRRRDDVESVGPMRIIYAAMCQINSTEKLQAYTKHNPLQFTAVRKPKCASHARAELSGKNDKLKTRPIYVLNGCLAHIFSALLKPPMLCWKPFLVSPRSVHAGTEGYTVLPCGWSYHPTSNVGVGFSWNYGGAEAMDEAMHVWGLEAREGDVVFRTYADDQYVWRKYHGQVWVAAPDVEQMDANMNTEVTTVLASVLRERFREYKSTCMSMWLDYYVYRAVHGHVMLDQGVVVDAGNHLISGVAGTTIVDQVGSAMANTLLLKWNERPTVRAMTPEVWMQAAATYLTSETSLKWKEDSLVVRPHTRGQGMMLPFLGFSTRVFDYGGGHYLVPAADPVKLMNSYFKPTVKVGNGDNEALLGIQMTRLIQLTVLGLYQHPRLYAWAAEQYALLKLRGGELTTCPGGVDNDGTATSDLDVAFQGVELHTETGFPTVSKCLKYWVNPAYVLQESEMTSENEYSGDYIPLGTRSWADEMDPVVADPKLRSDMPTSETKNVVVPPLAHVRPVKPKPFEYPGVAELQMTRKGIGKKYTAAMLAEKQALYLDRKAFHTAALANARLPPGLGKRFAKEQYLADYALEAQYQMEDEFHNNALIDALAANDAAYDAFEDPDDFVDQEDWGDEEFAEDERDRYLEMVQMREYNRRNVRSEENQAAERVIDAVTDDHYVARDSHPGAPRPGAQHPDIRLGSGSMY
jgi:hypothetical protein